jgi:hypothetical protein
MSTSETVTVELSKRAYDALIGLKRPEEDLEAFILRLATAARASGFFGQLRAGTQATHGGKEGS